MKSVIEIGEKCRNCIYYGYQTQTCDYMLIKKKSRWICMDADPFKFCDKFVCGKREYDGHEWKERYIPNKI